MTRTTSSLYRLGAVVTVCQLTVSVAPAQQTTITLAEAVRRATDASLDIRRRQLAVERSEAGVEAILDESSPLVTLSAEYDYHPLRRVLIVGPGNPFNTTDQTQAFTIGGRHSADVSAQITQSLFDPRRSVMRRVALTRVSLAQAELDVARATVRRDVERSFYGALYARLERNARDAQISRALANLEFTLARYRQGRALPLDTVTAFTSLTRARADAQRAANKFKAALLRLARTIGIADFESVDLKGELEIPGLPGPSGGALTASIGSLNSAEVKRAQSSLATARASRDAEDVVSAPSVDLVGRANTGGQSPNHLPDRWAWASTASVGVQATYEFSELWRGTPGRRDADLAVREQELALASILHDDSLAVETLLLFMESSRLQLQAEEATIVQATNAIETTLILYREGRATWLDVETAQTRLLDAQLAAERVKLEFLEAYADLKAIAGE